MRRYLPLSFVLLLVAVVAYHNRPAPLAADAPTRIPDDWDHAALARYLDARGVPVHVLLVPGESEATFRDLTPHHSEIRRAGCVAVVHAGSREAAGPLAMSEGWQSHACCVAGPFVIYARDHGAANLELMDRIGAALAHTN